MKKIQEIIIKFKYFIPDLFPAFPLPLSFYTRKKIIGTLLKNRTKQNHCHEVFQVEKN